MHEISDRSVATVVALERCGRVSLEVLQRRAAEVHSVHGSSRVGDVVGVATEVQRLGFAIERVQQR